MQTETQTVAIRTQYDVQSVEEARQILTEQVLSSIDRQVSRIALRRNQRFTTYINRVALSKPYQMLHIKKSVGKKTGRIKRVIQGVRTISVMYKNVELGDFLSTAMSHHIYGESRYEIKEKDALNYVKNLLAEKIENGSVKAPFEISHNYLKDYNLVPPKCDMFVDKSHREANLSNISQNVSYEQAAPVAPLVAIPGFVRESQVYAVLSQYFQKRPCWLKNVLLYKLEQDGIVCSVTDLKNALRHICYTYRNGPWKHTFCVFGFNPLFDSKSVLYQSVSIKLKTKEVEDYEEENNEVYDPSFKEIPTGCLRSYQLCDIALGGVQQILKGKFVSEPQECSYEHGWLSINEHSRIMQLMKQTI